MRILAFLRDPGLWSGYRWWLILGLMFCSWAIYWYGFAIGIFLPGMRDDLGLRPAQEGWLSASFYLGSFVFTIPLTNLLSRFPPVKTMGIAFLACTGLFFVAAAFPVYWLQLLVRFSIAVIFVANNPVRTAIIHQRFRPEQYALANGVSNSSYGVIESVAFWTTAPLLAVFGDWQGLFVFFGVFSAVTTAAWILLGRDIPAPAPATPSARRPDDSRSPMGVMRRREVWYMAIIATGGGLTWATYVTFWPTVAQETFGLSENVSGLVLGFTSIAIIPSSLASSFVLARLGRVPIIVGASLIQLPAFGLMLLTSNVPALIVIALVQGASWLYFPIVQTAPFQMKGVNSREIAVATAVMMVANMAALTIGPGVTGMLAEVIPLRTAMAIITFAPLVSVAGGLLLGEQKHGESGGDSRPREVTVPAS